MLLGSVEKPPTWQKQAIALISSTSMVERMVQKLSFFHYNLSKVVNHLCRKCTIILKTCPVWKYVQFLYSFCFGGCGNGKMLQFNWYVKFISTTFNPSGESWNIHQLRYILSNDVMSKCQLNTDTCKLVTEQYQTNLYLGTQFSLWNSHYMWYKTTGS